MAIEQPKDKEYIKNQAKTPERGWEKEFTPEENFYIERKLEALKYFRNKLDAAEVKSTETSQNRVVTLDRRMGDMELGSPEKNNEETSVVRKLLNNIAQQKQEAIKSGNKQLSDRLEMLEQQMKKSEGDLKNVPSEESSIEEVEENHDLKISKQQDITKDMKPKTEVEEEKSTETLKEKPLEVGDEVYYEGHFYKVFDLPSQTYTDIDSPIHERDKEGYIKKVKIPDIRMITITQGNKFGKNSIGIPENAVTRIMTPEQKEKIMKMKEEIGG